MWLWTHNCQFVCVKFYFSSTKNATLLSSAVLCCVLLCFAEKKSVNEKYLRMPSQGVFTYTFIFRPKLHSYQKKVLCFYVSKNAVRALSALAHQSNRITMYPSPHNTGVFEQNLGNTGLRRYGKKQWGYIFFKLSLDGQEKDLELPGTCCRGQGRKLLVKWYFCRRQFQTLVSKQLLYCNPDSTSTVKPYSE